MKRSLVAVLALSLALGGCGGSDGKKGSAASSGAPSSAPATAPAPSGTSDASGGSAKGGATAVPTAPGGNGTAAAAKKFNDCVRRQGVTMPSPHPKSTPSQADLAKIKAALQACVKAMSGTPAPTPK
ncbi:hypothetical protein [Actinomadura opuntiae]|uniref:hypothetical protein n=1 Tax=Actinomadura sp. OS1-43 TaxID=604315 RepID=UPI00255B1A99|nr:hypothetical protein [Actinomadura sp. OS1-43]MDL4821952.1 hypothetical protein [Actinomadura sp. OS1-43]